jgi:hypothetical protein
MVSLSLRGELEKGDAKSVPGNRGRESEKRERTGVRSRLMPGNSSWGEGPGKLLISERESRPLAETEFLYLAGATAVTIKVVPSSVPVTVAFLPACLSSVASAALSPVSSV